jgi:hypothetical protein
MPSYSEGSTISSQGCTSSSQGSTISSQGRTSVQRVVKGGDSDSYVVPERIWREILMPSCSDGSTSSSQGCTSSSQGSTISSQGRTSAQRVVKGGDSDSYVVPERV